MLDILTKYLYKISEPFKYMLIMQKALKKLEETSGLSADTKKEIMMQGDEALELYYKRIQEFKPEKAKEENPYEGIMNSTWFS